jgi:hypothetical protein
LNLFDAALEDLLEHRELGPKIQALEHRTRLAVEGRRASAESINVTG